MDIEQLAGTRLGSYEVESLLGKGGMGVIYKARQVSLNRSVALKILPPNLSSDSSFVKRFQREAQAIAQLDHSNIVQIIDISKVKA
ncbi:MAG: protein kinase domain-containing protein [Planctomycetota bacterium]|jgi:serine/threonine-protein kinase